MCVVSLELLSQADGHLLLIPDLWAIIALRSPSQQEAIRDSLLHSGVVYRAVFALDIVLHTSIAIDEPADKVVLVGCNLVR